MLHHIRLVSILNGFHDDLAFYISAVNIIVLKGPVAAGNDRLSGKSFYGNTAFFIFHLCQFPGNIPSVNAVNDIFQAGIAGAVELCLSVYHVFKRNILVGQGKLLHIGADITGLCHGCL